jgi:hypothetical protein
LHTEPLNNEFLLEAIGHHEVGTFIDFLNLGRGRFCDSSLPDQDS